MTKDVSDEGGDLKSLATTLVLDRARDGFPEAADELLSRVLPRIASHVRRERRNPILKNALDTMAVANDVAMELWKYLPRIKAQNSRTLDAYLARIVRNTLCDEYRRILVERGRFGQMRSLSSDSSFELDAPTPSVSSAASHDEEIARAKALLPLLGPRDEQLVMRRRFLGDSPQQIAVDFGQTSAWVRTTETRAYARYLSLVNLSKEGRLGAEIERMEHEADHDDMTRDDDDMTRSES